MKGGIEKAQSITSVWLQFPRFGTISSMLNIEREVWFWQVLELASTGAGSSHVTKLLRDETSAFTYALAGIIALRDCYKMKCVILPNAILPEIHTCRIDCNKSEQVFGMIVRRFIDMSYFAQISGSPMRGFGAVAQRRNSGRGE